MTPLVPIALFGWPFVAVLLFTVLHPRRAVLVTVIGGWLFLPVAHYSVPSLPDYSKGAAVAISALLGVLICDPHRLLAFRPRWFDLPISLWIFCNFFSSITNGLGIIDGLSFGASALIAWGIPYILGRLYFADAAGIHELAIGLFAGGLIYVPFCLYEMKMSPQLHRLIYGFHQHEFLQSKRFGGWRPMVFMQHGLAVALWMACAAIAGTALWIRDSARRTANLVSGGATAALNVVAILCRSGGAFVILLLGSCVLALTVRTRSRAFVATLLVIAPAYTITRATGVWSAARVVEMTEHISEERAGSLNMRLQMEDLLLQRAWERPIFGWAGWNRSRVFDESGNDLTVTDGLWIIAFGHFGLAGLVALETIILLPSVLYLTFTDQNQETSGSTSARIIALVLPLYMIDCLMNAMVNPVFTVAAGGLAAYAWEYRRSSGRVLARQRHETPRLLVPRGA